MAIDTGPHPLMFKWVLWELKPGNKHAWNESLMQIATFDSVEDFWMVHTNALPPSQLPLGSDYYLFREGIKPNWEDAMNVKGGRWQAILPSKQNLPREQISSNLDKCWLELMMSVIGAQYGDGIHENHDVCGVAAHVRRNQDKVALWIRDASDGESRERIGQTFQEKLHPANLNNLFGGTGAPVQFSFDMHSDSVRRYTVGTQQRGGRMHSSSNQHVGVEGTGEVKHRAMY